MRMHGPRERVFHVNQWLTDELVAAVSAHFRHIGGLPASGRHYHPCGLIAGMARRFLFWWVSTGTALVGVNLG